MSKSTAPAVVDKTFLAAMSTNVSVGFEDVVAVFVERYETKLLARQAELQAKIKQLKAAIETLVKGIKDGVDTSKYAISIPVLEMHTKVEAVEVLWGREVDRYGRPTDYEANCVEIVVGFFNDDNAKDKDRCGYRRIRLPISATDSASYKGYKDAIKEAEHGLIEVNTSLKNMGRKQRQVAARLSTMKIEQAGMEGLLENPELLKLLEE